MKEAIVLAGSRGIGKGIRDLATGNISGAIQSGRDVIDRLSKQEATPTPNLNQAAPTPAPTGISSLTQPSLQTQAIQDLIDKELSRRDQVTGFGRTGFMDT